MVDVFGILGCVELDFIKEITDDWLILQLLLRSCVTIMSKW